MPTRPGHEWEGKKWIVWQCTTVQTASKMLVQKSASCTEGSKKATAGQG
jgi:hypothetical protein